MDPIVTSALIGAGSQGLGMLGGQGMSRRQYHRQKKLMGFQKDHQKDLNVQGKQLAMDMWNQTNYGAQVEHMKDAGLNPALMYGSAGAGGSTNAGSGGSAQGGQAPQERVMDMQNMLLGAELALKKSIARKNEVEADKTEGVDTDLAKANIDKVYGEIDKLIADTKNVEEQTKLTKINQTIAEIEAIYKPDLYDSNIEKMSAEIRKLTADARISEESKTQIVANLTADYWLKQSESQKNWSIKELTDENKRKVTADIELAYEQMDINWGQLNVQQKQIILNDMRQKLDLKLKEMDLSFAERKLIVDSAVSVSNNLISTAGSVAGGTKLAPKVKPK